MADEALNSAYFQFLTVEFRNSVALYAPIFFLSGIEQLDLTSARTLTNFPGGR